MRRVLHQAPRVLAWEFNMLIWPCTNYLAKCIIFCTMPNRVKGCRSSRNFHRPSHDGYAYARVHCCLELPLTRSPSLLPQSLTWTEPARCWRRVSLQTYLEHMLPVQNEVMSLFLPSIIVHTDEPRKRSRPNASNTSPKRKRKLLLSFVINV